MFEQSVMLTLDAPFHALWSRNSLSAGGFSVDDFAVDHANRAAICPGGITVPSAAPARRRSKRLAAAARCALTCRLSRDNSGEPMQFTNRIIRPPATSLLSSWRDLGFRAITRAPYAIEVWRFRPERSFWWSRRKSTTLFVRGGLSQSDTRHTSPT